VVAIKEEPAEWALHGAYSFVPTTKMVDQDSPGGWPCIDCGYKIAGREIILRGERFIHFGCIAKGKATDWAEVETAG
jgi:hypothetical protein